MTRDMADFWAAAGAAVDKFCDDHQPTAVPSSDVVTIEGEVADVTDAAYDHRCSCGLRGIKAGFCLSCGGPCHC